MSINRIVFDIQGTEYVLPINPVETEEHEGLEYTHKRTLDGSGYKMTSFFDPRPRILKWENIPNNTTFQTMVANLKSIVNLDNVRVNFRDMYMEANVNQWQNIMVHDLVLRPIARASGSAIGELVHNIELTYSYVRSGI